MIKRIATRIAKRAFSRYAFQKYGGIWGIKAQLQRQQPPDRWLLELYDDYFANRGSWIAYDSRFLGLPCLPHGPLGIFVSGGSTIGKNVVIFQQVTIGSNTLNASDNVGSPVVGDNVYIGAGAKIIGGIVVGDNCRIGANAVVYKDMPPHSVAVQSPTRFIQKRELDNRFYSFRNGTWIYYDDGRWIEDPDKPH
jgi:serine O-acetyltransferase